MQCELFAKIDLGGNRGLFAAAGIFPAENQLKTTKHRSGFNCPPENREQRNDAADPSRFAY